MRRLTSAALVICTLLGGEAFTQWNDRVPARVAHTRHTLDSSVTSSVVVATSEQARNSGAIAMAQPSLSTDANSTATKDWSCIRWHESTNGKLSSNVYQFEGSTFRAITGLDRSPGSYPMAVQDAAALRLYSEDERLWPGQPFHAWSTRFICGLR